MVKIRSSIQLLVVLLIFVSLFAPLISAQELIGPPAPRGDNALNEFFEGLGQDLKGWFSNFLEFKTNNKLITVLLYFLVFMVIASIVNMMPLFNKRNWFFQGVVAVVVTTLSMILIPYEVLRLAVNPYSALGVVIITVMPFVFMMFFVYSTIRNVFLRHAAWAIFTLALIILGFYTLNTGDLNSKPNWYSYVYFLGAIGTAIMIWIGEGLEEKYFRGEVAKSRAKAQAYIDKRKLQMEFDELRAETELGIKPGVGSRKRLGP